MNTDSFVPPGFVAPTFLGTNDFWLEPLGPEHNDSDLAAWTSSIEHILSTPGFPNGSWPPPEGMSREKNLTDLEQHSEDFAAGKGFTFTVREPEGDVIGCVYLYPSKSHDVSVRSWVRESHAHLDRPLAEALVTWIEQEWPWESLDLYGR